LAGRLSNNVNPKQNDESPRQPTRASFSLQRLLLSLGINEKQLDENHQVIYTGDLDGIRTRDM
jgi:hypothetical protein